MYFSWVRVINLFFPSGSCFIATTLTAPDINILLNLKIIGAKQKIKFVLFARLLIWLLILEYNLFSFKLAFRQNLITVPQIWWKKRSKIWLDSLKRFKIKLASPLLPHWNRKPTSLLHKKFFRSFFLEESKSTNYFLCDDNILHQVYRPIFRTTKS